MNKMVTGSIVAASLALMAGCSTTNISQPSSSIASNISAPLEADIDIGRKISGESRSTILFSLYNLPEDSTYAEGVSYTGGGAIGGGGLLSGIVGDPTERTKAAAAYNAVSSSGADIIVAPKYVVDVKDYFVFKIIEATVEGRAGTLKSIRNTGD
mgnify:CR=1 FL=1